MTDRLPSPDPHTERRPSPPLPQSSVAIDPRLHQANERTFLAWVRTVVGLMAFGFVVARLGLWLRHLEGANPKSSSVSVLLGAAIVLFAAGMCVFATRRFTNFRRALRRGEMPETPVALEWVLSAGVTLIGLGLVGYLLLG